MRKSDEAFQIATLVVLTLTGVILVAYGLIFLDPRIAFNPFKPSRATPTTIAVATIQPTSTRAPSATPIATSTTISSPTPTATFSVTSPPAATPTLISILTPRATVAPTQTPTSILPTFTPTPISVAPPTSTPVLYAFRPVLQSCVHSGGTSIKGRVFAGRGYEGLRVMLATGPDARQAIEGGEQFLRFQADGIAEYSYTLKIIGSFSAPATWYLWLIDATGKPASDPSFAVQTNNLPPDHPAACWLAVIDFVR